MEKLSIKDSPRKENPASLCENAASSSKISFNETLKGLLSIGSFKFSLGLYKELRSSGRNVLFSPLSVRMCLAMTAEGAAGTTLKRINNVLELDEAFKNYKDHVGRAFNVYLHSLFLGQFYTLFTAHRVYARRASPIFETYTEALEKHYWSRAVNVDFAADPGGAAQEINKWMEKKTRTVEKPTVPPDSTETGLVLLSAVYFRGKFKLKFNPAVTKSRAFKVSDKKTIQVPTMHKIDKFECVESEKLGCSVLQLRYEGDRLALHVILPYEDVGSARVQPMLNAENVKEYTEALSVSGTRDVEVYLPKFRAVCRRELKGPLSSMGMAELFGESADLSRMSADTGVHVSSVVHQAHVVVSDDRGVAPDPKERARSSSSIIFRADRPFIYLIYDLEFQQILFIGNLDDPSISMS